MTARIAFHTKQGAIFVGLLGMFLLGSSSPRGVAASGDQKNAGTESAKVKIDLDQAMAVKLPEVAGLKPANFHTSDGKEGWVVRVPGSRPIATPAYADGLLFVGGGYGSHEFYAFNAKTGEVAWKMDYQR